LNDLIAQLWEELCGGRCEEKKSLDALLLSERLHFTSQPLSKSFSTVSRIDDEGPQQPHILVKFDSDRF
jgi:hypothetical protein